MHDYHDGLEGYDKRQLAVDGCGECDMRGQRPSLLLSTLDNDRFVGAWARAIEWKNGGYVGRISDNERTTLEMLYTLTVMFERIGVDDSAKILAMAIAAIGG